MHGREPVQRNNNSSLKTRQMVDEDRMRSASDFPSLEVSALSVLQCFDTVGWVTARKGGAAKGGKGMREKPTALGGTC